MADLASYSFAHVVNRSMNNHQPPRVADETNLFVRWLRPTVNEPLALLRSGVTWFEPSSDRLASVLSLAPSWTVSDILRERTQPVTAWLQDCSGRHLTASVSADAANSLHRAGLTLYIRPLTWLRELACDVASTLCLPVENVECAIFANHPGATTRMHFDAVHTLAIQVVGSKRWTTATNRHVDFPNTNVVTGDDVDPELRLYSHGAMPQTMPVESVEHCLLPGAMLYVPRGEWHETSSGEESLSLHIHITDHSWAHAIIATLLPRLMREREWRKHAQPLLDGSQNADAIEKMLASLRAVVSELKAGDCVHLNHPPIGRTELFVRKACSGYDVGALNAEGRTQLTFYASHHGESKVTTVGMFSHSVAAVEVIAASAVPMSTLIVCQRVPSLEPSEAVELVQLLQECWFIRPYSEVT